MQTHRPRLGNILIRHGIISQEELESAILYQVRTESMAGGHSADEQRSFRLGEALVTLGICTEAEIARALSEQLSIPFVDLSQDRPDSEAVRRVPLEVAREYAVLPIRIEGDHLLVAAADPANARLQEALQQATGIPIVVIGSASESQVRELLQLYSRGDLNARAIAEAGEANGDADEIGGTLTLEQAAADPEFVSAPELANACLAEAVRRGAQDIFFGPGPDGVQVQLRLQGRPETVATLDPRQYEPLLTHLKLMFGMELGGAPRRQEGRCRVRVDGNPVRLHAATVPAANGEGAVVRVL